MKYVAFSKGWQNNACLPIHKPAVSLLLENLLASAIIIYVSMWTVKPRASSFAGARTNETRDLLQYRACLEIF